MSDSNENILDLAGFRSKKLSEKQLPKSPNQSLGMSSKELGNHIDNIKLSIQRINKLMEELRNISDKPNK